jgi:hypothetical protein
MGLREKARQGLLTGSLPRGIVKGQDDAIPVPARQQRRPRPQSPLLINAELSALAPAPIPDLDQAGKVLEDFTIFWTNEADPANKRQFLSLIFDGIWLDDGRVVAVQPKPSFLPFFENKHEEATGRAGVKYGSDGTRTRDLCRDRAAL